MGGNFAGRSNVTSRAWQPVGLHLQSIEIRGYRGVASASGQALHVSNFGHRNVFIGPNNAGKSNIITFMHMLKLCAMSNETFAKEIRVPDCDPQWWWQQDKAQEIHGHLKVGGLGDALDSRICQDGAASIRFSLVPISETSWAWTLCPDVTISGATVPLVRREEHIFTWLGEDGEYSSGNQPNKVPFQHDARELIKSVFGRMVFIDAIRCLDRNQGSRTMDDGSHLLLELMKWERSAHNKRTFDCFKKNFIADLNTLLGPQEHRTVNGFSITGGQISQSGEQVFLQELPEDSSPQMFLEFDKGASIPLKDMGTGVSALVVLLAAMTMRKDDPSFYFVEEPEAHLHPALLRRLLQRLGARKECQFFASSHSSVVLDSLSNSDRIFEFYHDGDSASRVRPNVTLLERHELLDSLGVRNSALLQPNCIIWVEGPSDRIYVREWLRSHEGSSKFQEGSDYGFVFYGGRLLSHLSLSVDSNEAPNALWEVLRLTRFSAVLMDRDGTPGKPPKMGTTKQRILSQALEDTQHRLAIITVGREIENELPNEVLRFAIADTLDVPRENVHDLQITGKRRFFEEAIAHLGLLDDEAKTAKRLLTNKVQFALNAINISRTENIELKPPGYLKDLVELIERARV